MQIGALFTLISLIFVYDILSREDGGNSAVS